jgi:hypothetical protein
MYQANTEEALLGILTSIKNQGNTSLTQIKQHLV